MKGKAGYRTTVDSGELFVGKIVGSRKTNFFQLFSDFMMQQRQGKCRVYWGKHACNLTTGHLAEEHVCFCGCSPDYYSVLWGPDMSEWETALHEQRLVALEKVERSYSWHDEFDKWGNYRPGKRGAQSA